MPRVLRHRLEPLTHGIDLAELRRAGSHRESMRADLGVLPDQVVVVNIAHLRSEKAQHVLLAAAAKLAGDFDNLVFLSVGHGPLEEELRSLHRELDACRHDRKACPWRSWRQPPWGCRLW